MIREFKVSKTFSRVVPRSKWKPWESNTVFTKEVHSSFLCEVDDITFVDRYLTEDLEIDENRCIITLKDKGDIEIMHSYDEVKQLRFGHRVQIKGYGN